MYRVSVEQRVQHTLHVKTVNNIKISPWGCLQFIVNEEDHKHHWHPLICWSVPIYAQLLWKASSHGNKDNTLLSCGSSLFMHSLRAFSANMALCFLNAFQDQHYTLLPPLPFWCLDCISLHDLHKHIFWLLYLFNSLCLFLYLDFVFWVGNFLFFSCFNIFAFK